MNLELLDSLPVPEDHLANLDARTFPLVDVMRTVVSVESHPLESGEEEEGGRRSFLDHESIRDLDDLGVDVGQTVE